MRMLAVLKQIRWRNGMLDSKNGGISMCESSRLASTSTQLLIFVQKKISYVLLTRHVAVRYSMLTWCQKNEVNTIEHATSNCQSKSPNLGWFLMPWFVVECRLKCSFISIQNLYTGTHDMTLWQQTLKKQRRRNRNQLSILLLFIDVRVRVNTSLHLVGWITTRAHLFFYYIVSPDIVSI